MPNAKVLLTITDGQDNRDEKNERFNRAITLLKSKNIFSLSCGIGRIDVDHEGLTKLATATGGKHVEIHNSLGIASALNDLTLYIHRNILQFSQASYDSQHFQERHLGVVQQNLVRIAVDIFILIDCSWSMLGMHARDDWSGDKDKLPNTKEASINVLRTLNPNYDRIGVARFWEKYQLLTGLTSDFQRCAELIDSIEGGDGTGLYRAICFATEEF